MIIFLELLEISGISTSPATTIPSHPVGFGDVTMHLLKEVGGALILGLAAGMFVYQLTESRAAAGLCIRYRSDGGIWIAAKAVNPNPMARIALGRIGSAAWPLRLTYSVLPSALSFTP